MLRFVLMLSLALASQTVWATMYKWVDDKGEVHYSDTLPPQAVNSSTSELNKGGQVVKSRAAALTPEQRKAQEDAEKAKQEAAEKQKEQARHDNALLDSYTTEADIDMARDRNLQATQVLIDSTQVRIKSIQDRLAGLNKTAGSFTAQKKPVPDDVATDIKASQAEIKRLQDNIQKHKEAMLAIKARFDADKARFHELHTPQSPH